MGERTLLAEGREAEVFLQTDGTVLELMRLFDRWRSVRSAARLLEPIPSEHPKLLRFLDRKLRT